MINNNNIPASILYKSITTRYRFIKNANWEMFLSEITMMVDDDCDDNDDFKGYFLQAHGVDRR